MVYYKFLFFFSDFLEIQRRSFASFLNVGLKLKSMNFLNYKLTKPILNIEKSILFGKTYCCNLYVPLRSSKWVLLGTLPLLTRRGHFIINGTPRIILNQIVRSAGIYFPTPLEVPELREVEVPLREVEVPLREAEGNVYAEIISERGAWIQLEMDAQKKIWMLYQNKQRIFVSDFQQNLMDGFSAKLRDGFLKWTLMDDFLKIPDKFYVGQNGRNGLNKKLGLALGASILTPIDFVAITNILFKGGQTDDMDDLQNRRLKTIGELIQNQLIRGVQRLQILLKNKKKTNYSTPINSTLKEFFHSHQLSQYLDQSNPLAEITHKRRLSSGGVTIAERSIHKTHYGRICPIETPEGKNAGVVNSLTTGVHVNNGFLETPFLEVYKQHFQNQKKLIFFPPNEKQNIFFNQKFPKQKNVSISTSKLREYKLNVVNRLAKSAQQFLSIATTCIPFIEHDDANRALMGSNMQRQALPLIFLEAPLIATHQGFRVLSDLKDIATSAKSGFPIYVSKKKICLIYLNYQLKTKIYSKVHYMTFQKFYNVD